MKPSLLPLLAPGFALHPSPPAGDEIIEGKLGGPAFDVPIRGGVPRFAGDAYAHSFGLQWNRFRRVQLDSAGSGGESLRTFRQKTGLDPRDFAGKRVLDAGCGMGRFTELFADAGAEIVAIDLSSAVDAAFENVGRRPGVHVLQASVFDLPFPDASFDLVFSIGVLHHTPDCERALRGLTRLCAPGGTLAVWLYARSPLPWGDPLDQAYRQLTRRLPPPLLFGAARAAIPLGAGLRAVEQLPWGGKLVALLQSLLPKISTHPDPQWRVVDTFDWHSPRYRSFHSFEQVESWFRSEGFEELVRSAPPVAVRGRRPRVSAGSAPARPPG